MEPVSLLLLFGIGAGVLALRDRGRRVSTSSPSPSTTSNVYAYLVRGKEQHNQPPFFGFFARESDLNNPNVVMAITEHGRGFPDLAEKDVIAAIKLLGGTPKKVSGGMT